MTKTEKINELKSYYGKTFDWGSVFESICETDEHPQWKYDLEESDLMNFFSRTWVEEGYKAMVFLEEFICAPPYDEEEVLKEIVVAKINPDDLVNTHSKGGCDDPDDPAYYHFVYGDYNYSVVFKDEEWFNKLIPFEELPDKIFDDLYNELAEALKKSKK